MALNPAERPAHGALVVPGARMSRRRRAAGPASFHPSVAGLGWRRPDWLKATPLSCSLRRAPGGVPEWLMGADCKSVGAAYPGSNPGSPTSVARLAQLAEHLHGKEGVRGSSPRPGSISSPRNRRIHDDHDLTPGLHSLDRETLAAPADEGPLFSERRRAILLPSREVV